MRPRGGRVARITPFRVAGPRRAGGGWVPTWAGMLASTAIAARVASTAAASHHADGMVIIPPWLATLNSPRPSGMRTSSKCRLVHGHRVLVSCRENHRPGTR